MKPITRPLAIGAMVCATTFTWSAAPVAGSRDAARAATVTDAAAADAAMRGDAAAIRPLVRGGANVNAPQADGMTALQWAADRGDAESAALLLKAGADVRAVTRIGAHTPLHVAAKAGAAGVVKLLVD